MSTPAECRAARALGGAPSGTVLYRRPGASCCTTRRVRTAGAGTVLGLYVDGAGCRSGVRLVRAYQRASARAGRVAATAGSTAAHPTRLPRPLPDVRPLLPAQRARLRRTERRLYPVDGRYDANVTCVKGRSRIDHGYTLFPSDSVVVRSEAELRAAWANPRLTEIEVANNIVLHACRLGDPIRESSNPVVLDGKGHTLRQACFEKRPAPGRHRICRARSVKLTRGGSDGPGAAITSRGEITVIDSRCRRTWPRSRAAGSCRSGG